VPSVTPVFLFSLPRSGSTLLQRILAAHSAIATASEPWLLLPLLDSQFGSHSPVDFGRDQYVQARKDFCALLPDGQQDYREAVRRFVLYLYSRASGPSSRYFIDKTPRYHRIASEIADTFPDGKFIFLWRHPLAIAASMMETWSAGKWNLYRFEQDLNCGLANLVSLYRRREGSVLAVRYEDLLANPEVEVLRILRYLDLPFERQMVEKFGTVALRGQLGDPTGVKAYSSISTEPMDKWYTMMGNPLRRAWARRYIESLEESDLAAMGYSRGEMLREISGMPASTRHFASDLVRMSIGRLWPVLGPLEQSLRRRN